MKTLPRISHLVSLVGRSLLPGRVDEGGRIVQGQLFRSLIGKARAESRALRVAFNAGAGGGGFILT